MKHPLLKKIYSKNELIRQSCQTTELPGKNVVLECREGLGSRRGRDAKAKLLAFGHNRVLCFYLAVAVNGRPNARAIVEGSRRLILCNHNLDLALSSPEFNVQDKSKSYLRSDRNKKKWRWMGEFLKSRKMEMLNDFSVSSMCD